MIERMIESLGEERAIYDNKIKNVLAKIINKKETIINEYKDLKEIVPKYDKIKRQTFEKILNAKKQELEDILIFKKKQNEALFKLLEYLNSLEKKDKNLHIRRTLNKMKIIDSEISSMNSLLNS